MPDPLYWLSGELEALCEAGLLRRRRRVTPLADGWCEIDGRRLRNFASNNYLNLTHDPRVIEAARNALAQFGTGAGASALVTGRTDWHVRLEERLADFEGEEAAVLFPTGYAANVGTITALVGREDAVFSDRLNHASLIDGCRLSRARLHVYPHGDVDMLERELKKAGDVRRRLIVSDSLFSMDGDAAPLPLLCELAEGYEAALLIDEAHATGVFGDHGRGLAEALNVAERMTVRVGTLSKAVGALGGFVAGSQQLVHWLWNRARPQIFSTALPPAVCAAATAAINVIEAEPWRRERLRTLSDRLRTRISQAGFPIATGCIGPVVPVILDEPETAVSAAARLEDGGFLVAAIRPPTVPPGTSRLRISLTCAHTEGDVDALVACLARLR